MDPTLPLVLMQQACQFGVPIKILEPSTKNGNINILELLVINHLIVQCNPSVVFEMGTFDGRTTLNMAANTHESAKIYTIDLPKVDLDNTALPIHDGERKFVDKAVSGSRFDATQVGRKITQLFGDTAKFDFSPWFGTVDFVFVDASHTVEYVRSDTEVALKMLRDGGWIVWHDYESWAGVTEALDGLCKEDKRLINIEQIHGTTLAVCGPRALRQAPTMIDAESAQAYWTRYPDVAVGGYGENGRLGIWGAIAHYDAFGEAEGRVWGGNSIS